MQQQRHLGRAVVVACLSLALGAACNGATAGPAVAPTPVATPLPQPSPTAEPTPTPVAAAVPATTPAAGQQPGTQRALLPLSGEYAVTGNLDDRTLSVVPIGAATVASTVQLDLAPRWIGAAPNSDTVLAADGSASQHVVAIARLNAGSESGTLDVGNGSDQIGAPPPNAVAGPVLVITADETIRSLDPATQTLGEPLQLGAGPHTVSVATRGALAAPEIYVTNAGDGTVTVLDQKATAEETTLHVGGRPIAAVRTIDGRLWIADGDAGTLVMLDASSGLTLQTISVGPNLTSLAATPDGHYLALASSDADNALYVVDLFGNAMGKDAQVRHLSVPSGVLALATGAEISRAYATTGDGHLLYWDLDSNSITQTIGVGRNPMGLALGLVEPVGGVIVSGGGPVGGTGSGATGAGATGTGATGTGGSAGAGATGAGATGTGTGATGSTGAGPSGAGTGAAGAGATGSTGVGTGTTGPGTGTAGGSTGQSTSSSGTGTTGTTGAGAAGAGGTGIGTGASTTGIGTTGAGGTGGGSTGGGVGGGSATGAGASGAGGAPGIGGASGTGGGASGAGGTGP